MPLDASAIDTLETLLNEEQALETEHLGFAESSLISANNQSATDIELSAKIQESLPAIQSTEIAVAGIANDTTSDANVIGMSDGSHVVVFAGRFDGEEGIFARRTTSEGHPGETAFLIQPLDLTTATASPLSLTLSEFGDGSYLVAWTDTTGIHGRIVSATDQPQTSAFPISSASATSLDFEIASTTASDGRVHLIINDFSQATLSSILIDSLGNVGQQHILDLGSTAEPVFDIRVHTHSNADFALSWMSIGSASTIDAGLLHTGTFTFDGLPTESPVSISLPDFNAASEIISLTDGRWAIAGVRSFTTGDEQSIVIIDHDGNLLHEHTLAESESIADGHPTLRNTDEGGFALGYFKSVDQIEFDLIVQFFNDQGLPIGELQRANESPIPILQSLQQDPLSSADPLGSIASLKDGGIAAYWLGTSLDNTSPVIYSRTLRLEATPVTITISDPSELVDQENSTLEIVGLPADAGLSHGYQTSPTSWSVPLDVIDQLSIRSDDPLETITLSLALIDANNDNVAGFATTQGTLLDDVIEESLAALFVDGRGGEDTFVVGNAEAEYTVRETEPGEVFELEHSITGVIHTLWDIEFVTFSDATLDVDELIAGAAENLTDAPDEPEPSEGEVQEDVEDPEESSEANNDGDDEDDNNANADVEEIYAGLVALELEGIDLYDDFEYDADDSYENADDVELLDDDQIHAFDEVYDKFEDSNVAEINESVEANNDVNDDSSDASDIDEPLGSAEQTLEEQIEVSDAIAGDLAEAVAQEKQIAPPTPMVPQVAEPDLPTVDSRVPASPFITRSNRAAHVSPLASTPPLSSSSPQIPHAPGKALATPSVITSPPLAFANPTLAVSTAFDSTQLFETIDRVKEEVAGETEVVQMVAGSAVVLATGVSIAQIAWLLRSSALLTKLLSSMPIWVAFDPLPILSGNWDRISTNSSSDESLLDIARAKK